MHDAEVSSYAFNVVRSHLCINTRNRKQFNSCTFGSTRFIDVQMRPLAAQHRISWPTQAGERKNIAAGTTEDKKGFCSNTKNSLELSLGLSGKTIATICNGMTKIRELQVLHHSWMHTSKIVRSKTARGG